MVMVCRYYVSRFQAHSLANPNIDVCFCRPTLNRVSFAYQAPWANVNQDEIHRMMHDGSPYKERKICLFLFVLRLNVPVNNLTVMSGRKNKKNNRGLVSESFNRIHQLLYFIFKSMYELLAVTFRAAMVWLSPSWSWWFGCHFPGRAGLAVTFRVAMVKQGNSQPISVQTVLHLRAVRMCPPL